MRRSQADKAITHSKIVKVAARRFREKGLNGIGVADLMKQAGTSAGGFYRHFGSRDDLVVEALAEAFKTTDRLESNSNDLSNMLREYLGDLHMGSAGAGCAYAALAGDVRNASTGVRTLFTERLKRTLAHYSDKVEQASGEARRSQAILLFSAAVGGLTLARAVNDRELSQELLVALREQLIALAQPQQNVLPKAKSKGARR
jgi:TetR/AcrR family transcriptional regulator, transcriptional repressor for nem operon